MGAVKFRNTWGIDFSFKRERIRKTSPDNSKAGAQAYEAVIRQRLSRGETIKEIFDTIQKEHEQTFEVFAWKWYEVYAIPNNKDSELYRKKCCLRSNLIPFFGDTPLNKITAYQIEQFKAKKISSGLHPKTVNNHLTVLSSCLNSAKEWSILDSVPRIKRLKTPPQKIDFLTKDECSLLLRNSTGVWHAVFLTALKAGLRMGELLGLDWADINWDAKTLTVRRSWCKYKKGLVSPKSNKERSVPLTDGLYEMLLVAKQAEGPIFLDERNRRLTDKRVVLELKKACLRSGIRPISCHKLRHTFASHLAMAGAPIVAIQQLLGHSDIKTTMRYAHLSKSSLRDTVKLLEVTKSPFVNDVNIASTPPDDALRSKGNKLCTKPQENALQA